MHKAVTQTVYISENAKVENAFLLKGRTLFSEMWKYSVCVTE